MGVFNNDFDDIEILKIMSSREIHLIAVSSFTEYFKSLRILTIEIVFYEKKKKTKQKQGMCQPQNDHFTLEMLF